MSAFRQIVCEGRAKLRTASIHHADPNSFSLYYVALRQRSAAQSFEDRNSSKPFITFQMSDAKHRRVGLGRIAEGLSRKACMSNIHALRAAGLRVSEVELCVWLSQAGPNDVLEYHRGFLVRDIDMQITPFPDRERLELARVARRALWAAEQRLVHLVQRRCGENVFSYLAIARERPQAPSLSSMLLAEVA
jgi:hypothetical protein